MSDNIENKGSDICRLSGYSLHTEGVTELKFGDLWPSLQCVSVVCAWALCKGEFEEVLPLNDFEGFSSAFSYIKILLNVHKEGNLAKGCDLDC